MRQGYFIDKRCIFCGGTTPNGRVDCLSARAVPHVLAGCAGCLEAYHAQHVDLEEDLHVNTKPKKPNNYTNTACPMYHGEGDGPGTIACGAQWADQVTCLRCVNEDCTGKATYVSLYPDNANVTTLADTVPPSVLEEAQKLVHGDRGDAYGHPLDDFACTAQMIDAILHHKGKLKEGEHITAEDIPLIMECVKISRECNKPKRDNRTDGAGYWETLQMVHDELERRGK